MSYDIVQEDNPFDKFQKRIGDTLFPSSYNCAIILERDRAKKGPATMADGLGHINADGKGKGTGTVHIIAGMQDKDGNPDLDKDLSYVYLSMKTDADGNLGTDMEGSQPPGPAAIVKSDCARIVVRKDIKIAVDGSNSYLVLKKGEAVLKTESGFVRLKGDKIIVDAGTVELGEGATEKVILGDSFQQYFMGHNHATAVGPSGPPIQPFTPDLLSQRKVLVK
jgi:hypothetical protein